MKEVREVRKESNSSKHFIVYWKDKSLVLKRFDFQIQCP